MLGLRPKVELGQKVPHRVRVCAVVVGGVVGGTHVLRKASGLLVRVEEAQLHTSM